MSWSNSYTHTLALAVDRFAAAVFFNQPDITISSLCWMVRTPSVAIQPLKLYGWQYRALMRIGNALEHFFPGHCADARQGDIDTSDRARKLLGAP